MGLTLELKTIHNVQKTRLRGFSIKWEVENELKNYNRKMHPLLSFGVFQNSGVFYQLQSAVTFLDKISFRNPNHYRLSRGFELLLLLLLLLLLMHAGANAMIKNNFFLCFKTPRYQRGKTKKCLKLISFLSFLFSL